MKTAGIAPSLPFNPTPYLIEWLFEIGPAIAGAMGSAAIGWQDIGAWQQITGIELLPWEARILRRLSQDFISQNHDAGKPECPAPWAALSDDRREAVGRKISSALRALAASPGRP